MWMRKNRRDLLAGRATPLPTQVVSNEEFYPLAQTADQKRVEARINALADGYAARLGLTRREFLRTTGGMATAFMAMNEVFGRSFLVSEAEATEAAAYRELWPKKHFIFDAQLHHVKDSIGGPLGFRTLTGKLGLNKDLAGVTPGPDTLHRANFLKEVFFDSDTVMGIITGAAIGPPQAHALPAEDMVGTRDSFNAAAGSQRMLSHGIVHLRDDNALEECDRQIRELRIDGWKFYTGNPLTPWRLDDEQVAYPFLERSRKLGVRTVSVHKGLPLPGKNQEFYRADDIPKVARDFPDFNFIVYHSAMKNMLSQMPAGTTGIGEDGYIAWTTDLCQALAAGPKPDNVYLELGGVFAYSVITHPEICGHLLGQIIRTVGADHVIWGTDCIWWGSPQWLIEAFRRFQIPEKLQEQYGYAPISETDRDLIFGRNLARIYGVDVEAQRKAFPDDAFTRMKSAYLDMGPEPSHAQYGWIVA